MNAFEMHTAVTESWQLVAIMKEAFHVAVEVALKEKVLKIHVLVSRYL